MVFIILSILVHKMFIFYIKDAPKFTCPALPPKGYSVAVSLSVTGLILEGMFQWISYLTNAERPILYGV